MDRRTFIRSLTGFAGAAALSAAAAPAQASLRPVERASAQVRQPQVKIVPFPAEYGAGVIVISLKQRKLFLTRGDGTAFRYDVAVGKPGKAWTGQTYVQRMQENPAWIPPADVKHDNPKLPDIIPGGAPNNPMGPRALVLEKAEIAIHGTTETMRRSIGSAASYGCIRMRNEDVVDLFDRVRVGTPVIAIG